MKRTYIMLCALIALNGIFAQDFYNAKFGLGTQNGWVKLAEFDLTGGTNNSVIIDATINFVRTSKRGFSAHANMFLRKSVNQEQGEWNYSISGTEIGDFIKFKEISDDVYVLYGKASGNYGHMSVDLSVTKESSSLVVDIPTTKTFETDPDIYEDVPKSGDHTFISGNVGIGIDNPGHKLDVLNQMSGAENFLRMRVNDALSDYFTISNSTGAPGQFIPLIKAHHQTDNRFSLVLMGQTSDANDNGTNAIVAFDARRPNGPIQTRPLFVWKSYTTPMMTMLANGDLGIGTNTPDAKLAVNGNIHAKEVKVDLVGWPDYVFEEDYDLPTLEEVQDHIKEEGRLINLPSAQQVETNGIDLGEMNKLLLEKIEELTLYVIELKIENEIQDKKFEQLLKDQK